MTLQLYFARRFLVIFLGIALTLAVLLGLLDLVDEMGNFTDLPLRDVLGVVFLNMPGANYEILPLVMILASVALFLRLARSSELVVMRAAGRSALRGLLGPVLVALMIGVLSLVIGNPIVAATAKRHHDLKLTHRGGSVSALAIASEGLWLRQGSAEGQTVIFAARASSDFGTLYEPSFVDFGADGQPQRRINAETAQLASGEWQLVNAKIWTLEPEVNAEATARQSSDLALPSDLTQDRILESFGRPSFIPIWDLPRFIERLEDTGFSARRYAIWFHTELARPVFLVALVLISAAFTMRHSRGVNVGVMVVTALLIGFGLHYIRNFALILGENGQIPILLAAWAPPLAALFLGLGILLHLEDG